MAQAAAGKGILGAPSPLPSFTPGPAPSPRPAGCALCGCENPERRIGARSQPTPPRSGSRAGHAQCGRRAAVRQLGSSRSRAVGARTPAAASRPRQPPPDSGKLRGVPGALLAETDTLQIRSKPVLPPSQPESWRLRPPKCRRCRRPLPTSRGPTGKLLGAGVGREEELRLGRGRLAGGARDARGLAAPVGSRCQSSTPLLPQPLEGQQRVKSAPSHREHGPLQPPRPPAVRLGAFPEPPRGPEPRMRHRSPVGV